MRKLELVTVCFAGELRLLRLQARSLRLFACPRLVTRIKIVVNDLDVVGFKGAFEDQILPEYGALADKVDIIGYPELWGRGHYPAESGWRTQQVLKLLASRTVDCPHYLLLDAKNHFVRPISAADFFAPDGRMRSNMYRVHPPFIPQFRFSCDYFALAKEPDLSTGLPTATPFLMDRHITLSLIKEVEEREGAPFHQFFMGNKLVEFYLYYAYLLARYGALEAWYVKRGPFSATLFGNKTDDPEECADILSRLEDDQVFCMGIHRNILKGGNTDIINMMHKTWLRFGLINSKAEGQYFSTCLQSATETKQIPFWRRFFGKIAPKLLAGVGTYK